MSFPRINLADLTRMQRDWAALLPENPWGFSFGGTDDGRLAEAKAFGDNPGQLRLLRYVPAGLPANAPLVVALHGCGQDAGAFDAACGWSSLADRHGFALLYPEQSRGNNAHGCFNWFEPGDITRGQGETQSIHEMVGIHVDRAPVRPGARLHHGLLRGGRDGGRVAGEPSRDVRRRRAGGRPALRSRRGRPARDGGDVACASAQRGGVGRPGARGQPRRRRGGQRWRSGRARPTTRWRRAMQSNSPSSGPTCTAWPRRRGRMIGPTARCAGRGKMPAA